MSQINTLIKPTHYCNMRCKYCFGEKYGYEKEVLDIEKLKKYIGLLSKKYQFINLVWHGGEPLSVPLSYYEEIYHFCKKQDSRFFYSLQTNGSLLNGENIDFFSKNNTNIGLSFDGISNEKTRGNTEEILKGINLLQQNGLYPGAVMVVTQHNVDKLEAEYSYFKSLNLGMKMNPMFNDGAARNNSFFDLNPDEYIKNFISFFKLWAYDTDCNINVSTCLELIDLIISERSDICTFNSCLGKWLCFDSNGHIYPCDRLCLEQFDLGDVSKMESINEAFENGTFINLLRASISRRTECMNSCDLYSNCYSGCNANAILANEINDNFSCYIQKGILNGIKDFVLSLNNRRDLNDYNPTLVKKLVKR